LYGLPCSSIQSFTSIIHTIHAKRRTIKIRETPLQTKKLKNTGLQTITIVMSEKVKKYSLLTTFATNQSIVFSLYFPKRKYNENYEKNLDEP